MASYKNSNGASSIANEWGQWRYFNSALDKLGTAKPATISINENNVTIPEADNWMECFNDVVKGIQGGFEAKKELSYKLADDYLKSHSLEQYREEMTKGLVPFQDDPLAMARLKESHGEMLFQYITEDFQRRVDTNEFKGKAPEEVDAEFFKFMRENVSDVAKQFGYSADDVFFNRGVFTNSPTERIKMMARQKAVEHEHNVQDMFITESAKIHAIIQNGGDANALVNALHSLDGTVGRFLNPEKRNKLYTSIVQALENSPTGFFTLQQLADNENLPLSNGITLRQFLGEDGYRASCVKAFNYAYSRDEQAKFNYQQGLSDLAEAGNLSILQGLLAEEYKLTNNVDTDKTKDIQKYIKRAEVVQRTQLNKVYAEGQKALKDQAGRAQAKRWLSQASVPGADMLSVSSMDFTDDQLRSEFDKMVKSGYPISNIVNIASNASIPHNKNVARTFLKDRTDSGIGALKGQVDSFLLNGTLPKEPPKELTIALEAYRADPERFSFACGASSRDVTDMIILNTMLEAGRPYQDVVTSLAGRKKNENNPTSKANDTAIKRGIVSGVTNVELGGGTYLMDTRGKTFVSNLAYSFMATGNMSTDAAITKAKEEYSKHYYSVFGMSVPKGFFAGTYGNAGFTYAKEMLSKDLETYKGSNVRYVEGADIDTSYIVFEDSAGRYLGHLSPMEINKRVGERIDKERAEAEKRLMPTPYNVDKSSLQVGDY